MSAPKPEGFVNIKVFAGGSELPGEYGIRSIEVHKEVNRIASAELYFLDGDPTKQEFALSNDSKLDPGKEIEIKVGYATEIEPIFKGIIVKHGVKIIHGTSSSYIQCKSKAVLMTIENKSEIYEKKKDSDIFKTLIQKYSGLKNDVEATKFEHPQILQYDSTDWDFLVTRAELNSQLVTTLENKVSVKEPKVASPKMILEYGTTLLEFEADVNTENQLSKVIAYAWDIKAQKNAEKTVSSASFDEAGSLKASSLAGEVKKDGQKLYHAGAVDPNELNDWGTSKMLRSKLGKIRGRLKCKGYADINPGDTIEIKGVGEKFNGKFFVSAVKQEIVSKTWLTHIQFGLSEKLHTEKYKVSNQQASGLIPAVNGLQVGIVRKIHEDPDNQHRIQVSLPLFGSKTNVWARKIFPDAGNKRGLYFVPEVDDEVLVGFLNDDARFPVILGSLHSSKNATPYTTDDKNKEKGIVTRENLKLTFDDVDKIITIETPGEQSIVIDDKKGEITITDKSKNKVTMKKNLLELDSPGSIDLKAKKDVNIEGMKINIKAKTDLSLEGTNIKQKAKAQFKAEGSAKAEISSGGQTVVKAGAMVQVQGAIVKIN